MRSIVGELEAMLINLLYDGRILVNIRRPSFAQAQEWQQVTRRNYKAPGICHRVAPDWFAKTELLR